MAQFTQLGLSGKSEAHTEEKTRRDVAHNHQYARGKAKSHGEGTVLAFAGSVMAASLLAIFLLQAGGCSREKNKTEITAPAAASVSPPAPAVVSTPVATPVSQATKKVAKKRAASVTYSDSTYGISFRYPRWYNMKAGDSKTNSSATSMNFAQPGGVNVVSVEFPTKSYAETDLASGSFDVRVNKNLTAEECEQFAEPLADASGKAEIQPTKVKFGEIESLTGEEANQADAKYYHVFSNGACYEFALGMATATDGGDAEIRPVDRRVVFSHLEKILASVKIARLGTSEASGNNTTMPAASASAPSLPAAPDEIAK